MAKRKRQGSRTELEALKHSKVIEEARNQQRGLKRKSRGQTRYVCFPASSIKDVSRKGRLST